MIVLKGISKKFSTSQGLDEIHLTIQNNLTTALIGPSGCGKSTLLRLIVGLISPSKGEVYFDQELVTSSNLPNIRKKLGYVIQGGGLFPHLTALDNILLAANYFKLPKNDIEQRVKFLCELVQLSQKSLLLYPHQLSGGEAQRVCMMRALMLDPPYLLLDEPLGALDPMTRVELQNQLKLIFSQLKKTVLIVTHDMQEASFLADEIVLMRHGKIVQQGSFNDLATKPAEPFVKAFMQLYPFNN